jgi:FAD dependent oxidoreductase TIGR03364
LPASTRTIETDVCVVGAGLTGLAHALEARRRGLSVVLLERGGRATGASIRHSGHLFFSALTAGAALDAAPLARERWIELMRRAGATVDEGGTLIVARNRDELAVLEAAAAEPGREAHIRSAKRVGRLVPIPLEGVIGGFHAKRDLRIGPRSAPAALARLLCGDPQARVEWNAQMHGVEPGVVHAGTLRVRADAIIICAGADRRSIPSELWPQAAGLALRRTQMLRLAGSGTRRYRQVLATASTLLEHPGFWTHKGMGKLRERLELEVPQLIEHGLSLVVAQLAGGDLVVGSTATYSDSPATYSRERLDELILGQTRTLLGVSPSVRQRWSGKHLSLSDSSADFLTTRPLPGVRVVHAVRSTAAALCHAYAATVLDELLAGPPRDDMYITVRDMRGGARTDTGLRAHARAFGLHDA